MDIFTGDPVEIPGDAKCTGPQGLSASVSSGSDNRRMALVELVAEEMSRRWRHGERPPVEEFLNRHPELWNHPEAALELLAEELNLRHESGDPVDETQLKHRFPQWRSRSKRCWRVTEHLVEACPRRAGRWRACRLASSIWWPRLGRGGQGRVFLATQPALAGHPVVLKLAAGFGQEHLSLARLQHTHIVPLYSAHEFPSHGLRGLCLPFFGGTTLERLLAALSPISVERCTGQDLLEALERAQFETSPGARSRAPPVDFCGTLLTPRRSAGLARAWPMHCSTPPNAASFTLTSSLPTSCWRPTGSQCSSISTSPGRQSSRARRRQLLLAARPDIWRAELRAAVALSHRATRLLPVSMAGQTSTRWECC